MRIDGNFVHQVGDQTGLILRCMVNQPPIPNYLFLISMWHINIMVSMLIIFRLIFFHFDRYLEKSFIVNQYSVSQEDLQLPAPCEGRPGNEDLWCLQNFLWVLPSVHRTDQPSIEIRVKEKH